MDGDPHVGPLARAPQTPRGSTPRRLALSGLAGAGMALLCGVCLASAASVTTTSGTVAGGEVGVPRCSTAGILVFESISGGGAGTVGSIVLQNVDAACAGGTMTATVNSGGGVTASVSGTVPAGGGLMILTFTTPPTVVVGNEVDIVVLGP